MLAGLPALAQAPWLDANYGNESGCALAADGFVDGDDIQLLTPASFETYATYCDIVAVTIMSHSGQVVTSMCRGEGELETTIEFWRIKKIADRPDAYIIYDKDGADWGTVDRC
jgi:hypothetical protein